MMLVVKVRGVCPSYSTRRMAETAAYFVGHVFLQILVRQWVLSLSEAAAVFSPSRRQPGPSGAADLPR